MGGIAVFGSVRRCPQRRQQTVGNQILTSVPAGEAIRVALGQAAQNRRRSWIAHANGCREATQETYGSVLRRTGEGDGSARRGEVRHQRAIGFGIFHLGVCHHGYRGTVLAPTLAKQFSAGSVDQAEGERDVERHLVRLARRWWAGLLHRQCQLIAAPDLAHSHQGRTGLFVPASELRQRQTGRRFHRVEEVLHRCRATVVAGEIGVGTSAKALAP